jgi:hypothetical protein
MSWRPTPHADGPNDAIVVAGDIHLMNIPFISPTKTAYTSDDRLGAAIDIIETSGRRMAITLRGCWRIAFALTGSTAHLASPQLMASWFMLVLCGLKFLPS